MRFLFILLVNISIVSAQTYSWQAKSKTGALVCGSNTAAHAGYKMLQKGGTAIDAMAASLLVMSVTESDLYCFGGEVPIIVYNSDRKVIEVIAGQGVAPKLAQREAFPGKTVPGSGIKPSAVPAVVDAITVSMSRHGKLTFAEVAAPVLNFLDKSKKDWHKNMAITLRRMIEAEKKGMDRVQGLQFVSDFFYRGPIAREISKWCEQNGGLIRYSDMATHVTRIEKPLSVAYKGYTVYKCGPWTQGPYLLQSLSLLSHKDISQYKRHSADHVHLLTEVKKLAMADRDKWYADPLFEDVPMKKLLSDEYTKIRVPLIDMKKASLDLQPGDPLKLKALYMKDPQSGVKTPSFDTTTFLAADKYGNVVAATPSGWAGKVAGKTGVLMNTRLQSFNLWKGHPNCIEPGKRPRITLTPSLVFKDGKPIMGFSVAGGDAQDQGTLEMLVDIIDFKQPIDVAVNAPRMITNHHVGSFRQTTPKLGNLDLDKSWSDEIVNELKSRGHKIRVRNTWMKRSALYINPETGDIHVAGDKKEDRRAAALK